VSSKGDCVGDVFFLGVSSKGDGAGTVCCVLCAVTLGGASFCLPWNYPCLTAQTCTSMFTGYCVVRLFCGTAAYHLLGSLLILCVISLFVRSTLGPLIRKVSFRS